MERLFIKPIEEPRAAGGIRFVVGIWWKDSANLVILTLSSCWDVSAEELYEAVTGQLCFAAGRYRILMLFFS